MAISEIIFTICFIVYVLGVILAGGITSKIDHPVNNDIWPFQVVFWPVAIIFIPVYLIGCNIGKKINDHLRNNRG